MKKTLCFYFQIHQPVRLRRYRFFDIGKRHDYFDEYVNRSTIRRVAERCYLPMNHLIMDLIKRYGTNFKVSFSISGSALEQFALHAPEVIESFKELAKTGSVEFLAETYAHSLASLSDTDEFERQVQRHAAKMEELFGQKPVTLRNSSLIYSDQIGERVAAMGFESERVWWRRQPARDVAGKIRKLLLLRCKPVERFPERKAFERVAACFQLFQRQDEL